MLLLLLLLLNSPCTPSANTSAAAHLQSFTATDDNGSTLRDTTLPEPIYVITRDIELHRAVNSSNIIIDLLAQHRTRT